MNILFVASEVVPFAKTGGLADIVSSLASYLKEHGHTVRIVVPYYNLIKEKNIETTTVLDSMGVSMGPGIEEWCAVREAKGTGDVPVWFIEHDHFFHRDGLYHDAQFNDYYDNPRRYAFLSRAALQVCIDTGFSPDVIHVHDWQSALTAAYQKIWFWDNPIVGHATSVLTIHNAKYQGRYPAYENFNYFGINGEHFTSDKFEDHGDINMLKAGIYFADVVNTVSPTHAKEIADPHAEFGVAQYLHRKGDGYRGILNGIDYDEWSPEKDPLIPASFSVTKMAGKAKCKKALQEKMGLEQRKDVPIIGIVGRLVEQKGYHLLTPIIHQLMEQSDVQFAFLGSGDKGLEGFLSHLSTVYPGKFATWIGYSNELAHLIEAGSDMFLMPSMFEPCGLNQIYSLKYGTLPIVRAVGGLEDTVENYEPSTGEGTGFKFWDATPDALWGTISWAVDTYYNNPKHFKAMQKRAMKQDFSWDVSGKEYLDFYAHAQWTRDHQ